MGVRVKLAHAYDSIDFDILWDIVQNDLPTLIEQLKVLIEEKEQPNPQTLPGLNIQFLFAFIP